MFAYRIKSLIFFSFIFLELAISAQPFPPPAGQVGTTAIYKDSSVFVNWANGCRIVRGFQDISNPVLGSATAGDSSMAIGKAQTNGVVSLGDAGIAICTFEKLIKNGSGFDFAVFENGFNDTFLELAFVEVSSDGLNYVRFKARSFSDTINQYDNAAVMDAKKLNNFAGKYRGGYGTPFDLQELVGIPNLDINAISHVKIIDVVGSLMKAYTSRDFFGNKVNDPWPTPFPSSGFDLDAIGVIHEDKSTGIKIDSFDNLVSLPNPMCSREPAKIIGDIHISTASLIDFSGKIIPISIENNNEIVIEQPGIYVLRLQTQMGIVIKKIIVL